MKFTVLHTPENDPAEVFGIFDTADEARNWMLNDAKKNGELQNELFYSCEVKNFGKWEVKKISVVRQ